MRWEVTSLADLQRMKEKMDYLWNNLFEESAMAREWEIGQWVERLPKFEGTGRRCLRSRSNRTIKF